MSGEALSMTAERHHSFGDLARGQLPWLYRLARRMVGDDAEDVVQEGLLKAYQRYDTLRDEAAAPGWLRQIVINCARDRIRASARNQETPSDDLEDYSLFRRIAEEDPLPYSDALHLDFLAAFGDDDLWAVLDRLPSHYRVPLALVHMEGFTTRHVARLLGEPIGTLLSQLHRGRKLFERELWTYAQEQRLLTERAAAEQGVRRG